MRDDDDVIVLSGLTKLYEPTPKWMRIFSRSHLRTTVRALDGVDLVVRAGEICAVVGPNGAGKTTMFRIIVGLTSATTGSGSVLGLDVEKDSEQIRQVVGWMPSEDRSLLMRATSFENLQLHGRLQGMNRKELNDRIPFVLSIVNLEPQTHTVVAGLSAGMRARLRLARALLPGPRALILDEPTGPVDPIAAYGLLTLIMELAKQERLAVMISSHRLEEIEALQSHALLLDGGKVRYSGDLQSLRHEWERPQLELETTDHQAALAVLAGLTAQGIEAEIGEASVRCRPTGKAEVGAIVMRLGPAAANVTHIREIPMPLRDLIAQVYSRGGGTA